MPRRRSVAWRAPAGLAVVLFVPAVIVLHPGSAVNTLFLVALCLVVACGFVVLWSPNPEKNYEWPDGRPHA